MRRVIMISVAAIALSAWGFSVGAGLSRTMSPNCYDCSDNDPCKNNFGCLGYPECVCSKGGECVTP